MKNVYIVSAGRTPIGKMGGVLADLSAVNLGTLMIAELLKRAHVSADDVDEVLLGNVLQAGNGQNPARQAALNAGLPNSVVALTLNAVCGSGLESINQAAKLIAMGDIKVAIAGGMESMSNAPYLLRKARFGYRLGNDELVDSMMNDALTDAFNNYPMGITAENVATLKKVSKHEMDIFAINSQNKAVLAQTNGSFSEEIIPVKISNKTINLDEAPRPHLDINKLDNMKPAFKPDGVVTAANSAGINDGAAGVLLMDEDTMHHLGLTPIAKWNYGTMAGIDPTIMGLGPINSTQKLMEHESISINDIDLFEVNEAFAAQAIPVISTLKIPTNKVNIHGGSIALGHPVGASGARILVSLIYAMKQKNAKTGVATLCIGGGMGCSTLISR
ncbi:thiolase family protein [Pediococcus claussenii]|uniref:acetyl-CoA C-acetyltransferase n=1 Tax=Pediococcus claussenii (strain ATCC BAA-344 / DSM 14800 / JCM 18046 / KCTC 3811 / LMG 21948 / P06) TaxID=701521 RepID=G8PAV6_PEDCP|nr:acetyl-CoA C-acetyltransferase [Pediococcus claussenii]AEV95824.1 acetyl-CoA acetyltransferase [Pediococcus claussenii ATCC BAA-344]ANZ69322.1 acetyl-CoA acetyltransferase [Pediococcus claussenii]ANZ71142.1 acetyl-CoA acetyltransferase [Pediococcus claussenii]KRN20430.1 thlA protein [Pediococcus claussenii]